MCLLFMFTSVCFMVCGFFFFFWPYHERCGTLVLWWDKDRTQCPLQWECRILTMGSHQSSEVAQLCPGLCDSVDCSLPVSSTHGIFQKRVLEWVAISMEVPNYAIFVKALQFDFSTELHFERLLLRAMCYAGNCDLWRREFRSGVRDEAWVLGAFCVAKYY